MTQRAHVLVFLLYSLGAVLVAFWLPSFVPSVSRILAYIAGCFIVMAGGLLQQAMLGKARSQQQAQSLAELNRLLADVLKDQRKLEDDMLQLRATLANIASAPAQDVGNVVNEVKVLQKLIEQLYGARTAGAKAASKAMPAASPATETAAEKIAEKPAAPRPVAPKPAPEIISAPATGGGPGGSLPMPPVAYDLAADEILDALREGLRENGVELALQPIVTLPQRKRRFFECFSRVRISDGRVLTPEQYIDIAERHGLVTAIDNMQLFRCIQILRRIRKGNAGIGFFINISIHTLADRDFFREFINMMAQNAELAPAIVFEFSQRTMETADDALLRDLERLAQLGYRFSLDQVTHFDLNPSQLSSHHFRFMKVEAERLIAAARAGALGDDPQEFKRMLDSFAIDLIADHIESEPMLLELLDMHLDFGQGYLFGEPRIARAETAALT
ncbi:EAL domain-containing protein [Dongia rigui]|uniref:EAL domain-containing protein n=1 Tax=Dongia rigui TaxID=940149 RepID=A0ABU5DY83_9PROT|nr:EAL domain-containing protein [Dongia rigui]MDY0872235.1 EAL domain-containing protein [Dongia rigui]